MANQARKPGLDAPFKTRSKRARPEQAPSMRACDRQGCTQEGTFRTHRSPREMGSHVWYCDDHIREHNKAWNYFDGLTDEEVEAVIKNDTVWQRPTWELGSKADQAKARAFAAGGRIQDDFGLFNDATGHTQDPRKNRIFHPDTPEAKAYAILDLSPPITIEDLKARYKKLVKRHHPDANGGSKEAEEAFKEIGLAYQTILKHFSA